MNTQLTLLRATYGTLGRIAPGVAALRARELFLTPRTSPERPWEAEVEAQGERLTLCDGTSVLRFRGPGPRVLALHGWEGRATQWGPMAARLRAQGFDVFAPDGPAHGRSPGRHADMVAFARTLLSAERELGPVVAVLGHSMGAGATAIALASGLRAERAVLLASPSSVEAVFHRFARFIGLPPRSEQRFARAVEAHVGVPARDLRVDALAPRIATPALIVHDQDDLEIPFDEGAAIARAWPSAELLSTRGLGHRKVLRDPAVIDAASRFLGVPGAMAAE